MYFGMTFPPFLHARCRGSPTKCRTARPNALRAAMDVHTDGGSIRSCFTYVERSGDHVLLNAPSRSVGSRVADQRTPIYRRCALQERGRSMASKNVQAVQAEHAGFNARDWDSIQRLISDDCVFVDGS